MLQTDILSIGDITTDAFIKISNAEVHCDIDKQNCKLCVNFGDKIPYDSVTLVKAVGNSANAAVSAARLGLNSALLAYVGDDENGKDDIEILKKNNVDTKYVRVEEGKKTNYHYVLWYDVDRTILVKHESFSYELGDIEPPKWIYLSSLGDNTLDFHIQIADYIEKNPNIKLAFQPGTFQIKIGKEALKKIYSQTEIFFCNVEEAQLILSESSRAIPVLVKGIASLGPKTVVITDGFAGAYACDTKNDAETIWFMPVYPHTPIERTGAGDAFASTIVSAIILGKTLQDALTWAPINSMSVVQKVGAQEGLLSKTEIENYLAKAPEDYKPSKLNS
ncbi:carbohydrate kinase family protein [Patescibacteria group bacterium]|nr:carbohydrate kinase family protein [Patescibacteria group bacterium]